MKITGRRKKEPASVHRENISSAAQLLFAKLGFDAVTMDDIAKAAGYSKATLYVYFKNKEEIIALLTLKSMQTLCDCLEFALNSKGTRERYDAICISLLEYSRNYPFYFKTALEKINIDFRNGTFDFEDETFRVGERINESLLEFFLSGVESGDLRKDLKPLPTIFSFWGMISGLIQLSASKGEYIESRMSLSENEFLQYSFAMLYSCIENKSGG